MLRAMKSWKANGLLLLVAFSWGSTFTMVKGALDSIPPATFLALRFLLASILMAGFARFRHTPWQSGALRPGILVGLALGIGYLTQTIGLQTTTAGKTGFITGMNIILVPLIVGYFWKHKIPARQWVGVLVSLFGLGLLCLNETLSIAPGDLWVLSCAFLFALQIVGISHWGARYDAVFLTLVQLITVALVTLIVALIWESPSIDLPLQVWSVIAFTALFATLFAFLFQMLAQPHTTPTKAAITLAMESPLAVLFGWWWGGETMLAPQLWGCALMLLGMIVVQLPIRQKTLRAKTGFS